MKDFVEIKFHPYFQTSLLKETTEYLTIKNILWILQYAKYNKFIILENSLLTLV